MSELEEDKKINMNRLDLEVSRQPELYHKYGKEKARAELRYNAALVREEVMKNRYKRTKYLVFSEVKKNPKKFNIDGKATDPIAESESENDSRTVKAYRKYIKARMKVALLKYHFTTAQSAHESMIDRRKGIDNAIVLYMNQYYGGSLNERRLKDLVGENRGEIQRARITPLPKRRKDE